MSREQRHWRREVTMLSEPRAPSGTQILCCETGAKAPNRAAVGMET